MTTGVTDGKLKQVKNSSNVKEAGTNKEANNKSRPVFKPNVVRFTRKVNEHEPSDDNKGINDNKLNNASELRKRGTLPKRLSLTTSKMTMQKNEHLTAMYPH